LGGIDVMNYVIKEARSVEDAITEALVELGITSEEAVIEIVEKQSGGLFGIFSTKLAKVKVSKSATIDTIAESFLTDVFKEMELEVSVSIKMDEEMNMNIDLSGPNMGVLIGKRGQTLDSLQYLVSLVVNKESEQYIRVKLDTEAYRERRKQTLENLAKNLANKVKKSGKKFTLEPMNPYERRIIHFTLQNNKAVETHSEGEEPYRKVIIVPSKQK
jgi:spoIIIJ-associated protein